MSCHEARVLLAEAFDEGVPLGGDVERHLRECTPCREYCERLRSLEAAMGQAWFEPPCADLGARIRARLAADESRRRRGWAIGSVVVSLVAFCLLEWAFAPVAFAVGWLSEYLAVCVPPHSPSRAGAFLLGQMDTAWAFCSRHLFALVPENHLGLAWALFGAVVLVLVVFDGVAVARHASVGRVR